MHDYLNIPVNDRQSFAQFLQLLLEEYQDNKAEWENKTLEDFLEAMSRYAEDIQGNYNNVRDGISADVPAWSTFADIMRGAVVYE